VSSAEHTRRAAAAGEKPLGGASLAAQPRNHENRLQAFAHFAAWSFSSWLLADITLSHASEALFAA